MIRPLNYFTPLAWIVFFSMVVWVLLLGWVSGAWGSPFLVCDPQAGIGHYVITGDPFWTGNIPAQVDGALKTDLMSLPVGVHSINVAACSELWGCSTTAPFTFQRPALLPPAAIIIMK